MSCQLLPEILFVVPFDIAPPASSNCFIAESIDVHRVMARDIEIVLPRYVGGPNILPCDVSDLSMVCIVLDADADVRSDLLWDVLHK